MELYKEILTRLHTGYMKTKYILGFPLIISETIIDADGSKRKRRFCPLFKKQKSYADKTNPFKSVFYLKINRTDAFAYKCIQYWVNIVNELNADFYFICDNSKLKQEVLKRVVFKNRNIKFIKSKRKELKSIIKNIVVKFWYNAGYAHLTTFLHAEQNNYDKFWNIDADDTLFVCEENIIAEALKSAEKYADKNNIEVFAYDMHISKLQNKICCFGISLISKPEKWINIFKNTKDSKWQEQYPKIDGVYNVDHFFSIS